MTPKFKIGDIIKIVPILEFNKFIDEKLDGSIPYHDSKKYLACAGKIGKIMDFVEAVYGDNKGRTIVYSIYIPEVPDSEKCIIPEELIEFPRTKQTFYNGDL